MAHVNPHDVMAKRKDKEILKSRVKAALLDFFFVFYSVLVVDRVIWNKFILQVKNIPFSWTEIGIIALSKSRCWCALEPDGDITFE
jgi:hypothetical protein